MNTSNHCQRLNYVTLMLTTLWLSACVNSAPPHPKLNAATAAEAIRSVTVPETIDFNHSAYVLVNRDVQDVDGGKIFSYQYTSDGQSSDDWQTMITIAHNTVKAKPNTVLRQLKADLEETNPKPLYDIKFNPTFNAALAQIVYEPRDHYAVYEASTWLIDFALNCPGYTSIQIAARMPADTPREKVLQINDDFTQQIVSDLPKLSCLLKALP